jgi:hypothetical protein
VPDVLTVEQLSALVETVLARNAELEQLVSQQADQLAVQGDRIAELERRLGADSSNSSKPPSSDSPWAKPAGKRSSRTSLGRNPGKQPGESGSSRSLIDDLNHTVGLEPPRCRGCGSSLEGVAAVSAQRRQVVDVLEPAPLVITEYQRMCKACQDCGVLTEAGWESPQIPQEHGRARLAGAYRSEDLRAGGIVDLRALPAGGLCQGCIGRVDSQGLVEK